jgi:hypothetical protein
MAQALGSIDRQEQSMQEWADSLRQPREGWTKYLALESLAELSIWTAVLVMPIMFCLQWCDKKSKGQNVS